MPCTYYETEEEKAAARKKQVDSLLAPYRRDLNRLTKENDFLRELVLAIGNGDGLTAAQLEYVEQSQAKHRQEDLDRLKETFKASGDFDNFEKVVKADPTKPLAAQLGFDPDEY